MAVAPSAFSLAANRLRECLAGVSGLAQDRILIANPKEAAATAEEHSGQHYLNLFFYNLVHGAHPADGTADEPFFVRLHCLITALGADDSSSANGASAGENELRLLGEVMRLLHETPHLTISRNGTTFANLQVVLNPLSLDDINRIWSTQADTPYRLSVAYELALVPVPLKEAVDTSLRVGSLAVAAVSDVVPPRLPETGFGYATVGSPVPRVQVDGQREDWTPHIAFVGTGSVLEYALAFDLAVLPTSVDVLLAGKTGESVDLTWETWSAEQGWQELETSRAESVTVKIDLIDPAKVDPLSAHQVPVPIHVAGQAMLYAVRVLKKPGISQGLTLRSNPLLLTVFSTPSPPP